MLEKPSTVTVTGRHRTPAAARAAAAAGGVALALLIAAGHARANSLRISSGPASGQVEIEARDAEVDTILVRLGQVHGFQFERLGGAPQSATWSGRYQGRLEDALAKILGTENYVVEHANQAVFGIAKVKVFGFAGEAEPQAPVSITPKPVGQPGTLVRKANARPSGPPGQPPSNAAPARAPAQLQVAPPGGTAPRRRGGTIQ